MTPDEAMVVLARRDAQSSWQPNLSQGEIDFRAADLARRIPDASLAWALDFVMEQAAGGTVPTDAQIIAGWRAEQERLTPAQEALIRELPDPPQALPAGMWPYWERARHAAIRGGATREEAITAANNALGVEPDPEPTPDSMAAARAMVQAARARVNARRVALDAIDGEALADGCVR